MASLVTNLFSGRQKHVEKRADHIPRKEWDKWKDRFFEAYNSPEAGKSARSRVKYAASLLGKAFRAKHGIEPVEHRWDYQRKRWEKQRKKGHHRTADTPATIATLSDPATPQAEEQRGPITVQIEGISHIDLVGTVLESYAPETLAATDTGLKPRKENSFPLGQTSPLQPGGVHVTPGPAHAGNREMFVYAEPPSQYEIRAASQSHNGTKLGSAGIQASVLSLNTEISSSMANHSSSEHTLQDYVHAQTEQLRTAQEALERSGFRGDAEMVDVNRDDLDHSSQAGAKNSEANGSPRKRQRHKRTSSGFKSFSDLFKSQCQEDRGRPPSWGSFLSSISGSVLQRLSRSTMTSSHRSSQRSSRPPRTPEIKEARMDNVPPVPAHRVLASPSPEHIGIAW